MSSIKLIHGDCLDKLKELDDNSVDSIVTDPPYMIGFMGKDWDKGDDNIAGKTELWKECLRVLKPGGHLLSFGATRTYHRMTIAIEDAGFEIRDCIFWCYGSGFPKSHNIGKAVDKLLGNEREYLGETNHVARRSETIVGDGTDSGAGMYSGNKTTLPIAKGQSEWEGWGTALKPAHEPIVVARKPLSEKSVAENVLKWGTGGINVDGCRIAYRDEADEKSSIPGSLNSNQKNSLFGMGEGHQHNTEGRFPANIIFDEEAGKMLDEQSGISKSTGGSGEKSKGTLGNSIYGKYKNETLGSNAGGVGDIGGASRFFYCPKVSKSERNEGVGERNTHPTVKPTDLMLYLIRLVTPKGGITLDPFMGSGSSGKAAVRGGFDFIGIERESDYMEIAESRINWEMNKPKNKTKSKTKTQIDPNTDDTLAKFWE